LGRQKLSNTYLGQTVMSHDDDDMTDNTADEENPVDSRMPRMKKCWVTFLGVRQRT
jgi:hypothetical protein